MKVSVSDAGRRRLLAIALDLGRGRPSRAVLARDHWVAGSAGLVPMARRILTFSSRSASASNGRRRLHRDQADQLEQVVLETSREAPVSS
jgi:hypothetical protein